MPVLAQRSGQALVLGREPPLFAPNDDDRMRLQNLEQCLKPVAAEIDINTGLHASSHDEAAKPL